MKVPYKFKFYVSYDESAIYTATRNEDSKYIVSWIFGEDKEYSTIYSDNLVETFVEEDAWIITETLIETPKFKVGDTVEVKKSGWGFGDEEVGKSVTITEVEHGKYIDGNWSYRIEEEMGNNVGYGWCDGWHGEGSFVEEELIVDEDLPFVLKSGMRVRLRHVDNMFIVFADENVLVGKGSSVKLDSVTFDEKGEFKYVVDAVYERPEVGPALIDPYRYGLKLWPARTEDEIRIDDIKVEIRELQASLKELNEELKDLGGDMFWS